MDQNLKPENKHKSIGGSRLNGKPMRVTMLAVAVVTALLALFDWNWLRHPLERYLSEHTGRTVTLENLQVKFGAGLQPTVWLRGVYVQNAPWADKRPMAVAGVAAFTFSLASLIEGRPIVSRIVLNDADVDLERQADGLTNWRLAHPEDRSPGKVKILALEARRSKLHYDDRLIDLSLLATASTLSPQEQAMPRAQGKDLSTKLDFNGAYRGVKFSGEAWCGSMLTFYESGTFPVVGHGAADDTRVDVDGTMSDAVRLNVVDARLRIGGGSLSKLYPFLLLPLPNTHAYMVEGRLRKTSNGYEYSNFRGKIGKSDIAGNGSYIVKSGRPLLLADLHSATAELADLGPLIGIEDEKSPSGEDASGMERETKARAPRISPRTPHHTVPAPAIPADRVLPKHAFDVERLTAIDARVTLIVDRMRSESIQALESLRFTAELDNGVLQLKPIDFGVAGGHVTGVITLDANRQPMASRSTVTFHNVQLNLLFPAVQKMKTSAGIIAARLELTGSGESIRTILGNASGSMAATMEGGRISDLLDAELGLNGGRILSLMIGGDHDIDINCGALAFEFENGLGRSRTILLDTQHTRTEGRGTIDLRDENFDFLLAPRPKHPGILSLRSPIRLYGTFEHPDYAVDKGAVLLRAGGATALGALNPLAFLLPLIEPGTADTNRCAAVLGASQTAGVGPKPASVDEKGS